MKSPGKKLIVILIGCGAAVGLAGAFIAGRAAIAAEAEREKPVKAPTRVEAVNGETVVHFDAATRARSGVVLGTLAAVSHQPEVRAYGTAIELGEPIALRHDIAAATAQLAKAQAAVEVARQEHERAKGLFQANQNVAEKVVQAAAGTWRAEEANAQAATAALAAARATARQRWGAVVSQWLAEGAPEFERLSRQDDLLVQLTLAPAQSGLAAPPRATVATPGGHSLAAKFVSPAPRTDPKIQGRSFFYVVPAGGADLLPGMNVTALLPAGEPVAGAIVPAGAVVWTQGKPWVYAQVKPDRFVRREVSTAQPVAGGWFQPGEFSPGRPLVVQGAQLLLSEEFRAQISVGEEK